MKLLFADDERSLQELMRLELPRMGHEVTVCPDGTTAVAALELNTYDCLLVDLDMPGYNGIDVIAKAKELSPGAEAIVLTGKSSLETAVAALRHGAFDYLTKPCRLVEIQSILDRVAEKIELTNKYRALKQRLERLEGKSELIGDSAPMEQVRRLIAKVAPTNSTVIILGETGTGKELVARAIHDQSLRADGPLVAINCGALPEHLIESELFGHRKGAFTGAEEHRTGLFEVADGGTLFLDEIGELPKSMQAKLLRFLESGEIRRVGENESVHCDVRVVCATHRALDEMVADGEFREDLWFRINTFEIQLPPLRDRLDDVPALTAALAGRFGRRVGSGEHLFAPETLAVLNSHTWPGNVRELANVVEHAIILCGSGPLLPEHLPSRFSMAPRRGTIRLAAGGRTLREIEMQAIHDALDHHQGNKPRAADELGISLKTLYNKLNQSQDGAVSKSA
ncbi:MAG: sigma-54-dependent Fis family transcriptional regulator [Pirellulales bacterium]|nr:sigma-54-dependent Fis family transcriptional regulator [Pirellulales bacterium]